MTLTVKTITMETTANRRSPLRKVHLRSKEMHDYQLVKNYVDHGGRIAALALRLNCSERTARRKINGYKQYGKAFFLHGNRDRTPVTTTPPEVVERIITLYLTTYEGANFTHFHELLERYHADDIPPISLSCLRKIMKDHDILSPKAHRATKRAYQKKMDAAQKVTQPAQALAGPSFKEEVPLQKDPHPRREKSRYMGELVFLDASQHDWLEEGKMRYLHAIIDDASGMILGAYIAEQETLQGYYQASAQMLRNHGIPHQAQTDGRTVFEYAAFSRPAIEKDTYTQFGYAYKTLGIELRTTASAQAQGKIERLFQTLQSRLLIEFRIHHICTIKGANDFLLRYLPQYNAQFATPLHSNRNAFELPPSEEEINLTLAILSTRIVDTGCAIQYEHQHYRFLDARARLVPLRHKTKVTVIKALDGKLYAACKDTVFSLDAILDHKTHSKQLDDVSVKPMEKKPIYIPPMTHPWRNETVRSFQEKSWDHQYSFDELCYSQEFLR